MNTFKMRPSEIENQQVDLYQSRTARPRGTNVVLLLILFAIIPTAFFVEALQLSKASGPQWLGLKFENSYTYLFNSLLIVNGESPAYTDHPGVTTELFGAACLRLSGHGPEKSLTNSVAENPEHYLKKMHRALLIVCALAVWIFPLLVARRIQSPVRGLLLQVPVLFFNTILSYTISYNSDVFLVIPCFASIYVCILLLRQRKEGAVKLGTCLAAGVVSALGITTKLTFFPLILISLFCCRGFKSWFVFACGFVIASAVVLIPIYSEIARVFTWILALATHSGYYGNGEVGFARADAYIPDIISLLSREPSVALIPIASTIVILIASLSSRRQENGSQQQRSAWTASAILILQLLSFLIVAKHANFHYLIPLYLSTGINLVLLYDLCRQSGKVAWKTILAAGVLAMLLLNGFNTLFTGTISLYNSLRSVRTDQLSFATRVRGITKDAVRVDYYPSITPEFALCFGNGYARRAFARNLEALYPRALFFNIFNGRFESFSNFFDQSVILAKYEHLYFFGDPYLFKTTGFGEQKYFKSKELHEVAHHGDYVLQEWIRP
jgi:hypothetical protein